jgi:hypothetical protein
VYSFAAPPGDQQQPTRTVDRQPATLRYHQFPAPLRLDGHGLV